MTERIWNGAHKALLSARNAATQRVIDTDRELGDALERVATLRTRKDTFARELAEIDTVILAGDFTPPSGLDIWGERTPENDED